MLRRAFLGSVTTCLLLGRMVLAKPTETEDERIARKVIEVFNARIAYTYIAIKNGRYYLGTRRYTSDSGFFSEIPLKDLDQVKRVMVVMKEKHQVCISYHGDSFAIKKY